MINKVLIILSTFLLVACAESTGNLQTNKASVSKEQEKKKYSNRELSEMEVAYLGSGCFWCVEAIFESVEGVAEAVSGYAGGKEKNPTYQLVSSGRSLHAEVVAVYYDKDVISYETLLKAFFGSHDPTTKNRQGPDAGPQYRSIILYQNDQEKEIAESFIATIEKSAEFGTPITTEVVPLVKFYKAEDYHQDYEKNNPYNPYVQNVSVPRLKKFKKAYPELLSKDNNH